MRPFSHAIQPLLRTATLAAGVLAAIFVVTVTGVQAANVTLAWDSNAETDLSGYIVYYGTASRSYPHSVDVGKVNSYEVTNLTSGTTYYFAVTAYDTQRNESAYSNEITHSIAAVDSDGDGISDQDETNIHQTDPNLADTDGDGLSDGDEITLLGTDPLSVDTDGDGLSDGAEVNVHGSNPKLADSDSDGLSDPQEINTHQTNPNLADTDGDGLTDGSEVAQHGTDPRNADTDQDGLNDGYEVANGWDPLVDQNAPPVNDAPDKPVLLLPADGQANVSQLPVLQTNDFVDPDGDSHAATWWQISTDNSFGYIVYSLKSTKYLTALAVPEALLDIQTTYYWRVRFYDPGNAASEWADPFAFTTVQNSVTDADQDGVPDSSEVDASVDLDEDGVPDIQQPTLLSATTSHGDKKIGIGPDNKVKKIRVFMPLDPNSMAMRQGMPSSLPYGMVSFRIEVDQPGDTAYVTFHLSDPAPEDARWYKYDLANGWYDFTSQVTFSPNRKKVTMRLTDGGLGDGDGAVNGVILDPSGLAAAAGDGGIEEEVFKACFISAATSEHPGQTVTGATILLIGLGLLSLVCSLFELCRKRRDPIS